MKSSLKKLRGFALHRNDHSKEGKRRDGPHLPVSPHEELLQASQEMQDMRSCYDSLLSASAATANSAYEFSEALREMGTCLLEKIALNDDDECGRVLLMLGKAQFELQKLVDTYRVHVVQTISTPSESLIKELQTVEEMKRQCDDKRELYKFMQGTQRDNKTSNNSNNNNNKNLKGENLNFSTEQIKKAEDDYHEEATLFVFRLKSLKQGQFRSLLTQATRHHAAQLNFFKKGAKSLESVEPHVRGVADREHIDYHFTELDDVSTDDVSESSCDDVSDDAAEVSFDYGQQGNNRVADSALPPRVSVEESIDRIRAISPGPISHSEPILLPDNRTRLDPSDKINNQIQSVQTKNRPSSPIINNNNKPNTYILPTPSGDDVSMMPASRTRLASPTTQSLWHSSPLKPNPSHSRENDSLQLPNPTKLPNVPLSVLREKNRNGNKNVSDSDSDSKKLRISELHELPRPPPLIPHSAPLISKGNQEREFLKERRVNPQNYGASRTVPTPLPAPPPAGAAAVMGRSYSIPSRGARREKMVEGMDVKLPEEGTGMRERFTSSPNLMPIALKTVLPTSREVEKGSSS